MGSETTAKRLVLLNTSIITAYGTYQYKPATLADAKALIVEFQQTNLPIESAIGHQATADLLASLLSFPVTVNRDRKSTRLNSSHVRISYAVFCLKKKKKLYYH